jgi:hypothetical protein
MGALLQPELTGRSLDASRQLLAQRLRAAADHGGDLGPVAALLPQFQQALLLGGEQVARPVQQLGQGTYHLLLHRDGKQWNVHAVRQGGKNVKTARGVKVSKVHKGERGKKLPASRIKKVSLICVIIFLIGTEEKTDPDQDDDDNSNATPLYIIIRCTFA